MQRRTRAPSKPLFADPDHEPPKTVDLASFHPVTDGAFVTLCALVSSTTGDDRTLREPVVAARLRLDRGRARAIIEGPRRQVAAAEADGAVKT